MKKTIVFLALALGCAFAGSAGAIDVGTSQGFHRQRFEAWGTSLAWMGNELGGWSPSGPRDQLNDLLFDGTNNLGLNFVRYNIGAGQNPNLSIPRPGAEMDGWVPNAPSSISDTSTWQWDWNADATQRWMLNEALARGVNQVEAFANSAPWWMTASQDSTGAPNQGQANLSQSHFDEFAHYLGEVVDHFESNLGIHFHTLAPMNEPGAGWWTSPGNQEGMNVPKGQQQAQLIHAVGAEIQNRGFDIGLVALEETSVSDSIDSWQNPAFDALAKSYVDQINTHTYPFRGGSDAQEAQQLLAIAQAEDKQVFASEYGVGDPGSPLNGGISLANRITGDLRNLRTPGWTYWQAIENNNGSGWGLIIAPYQGAETFFMRQQYQVMRQFSAYIRPGAQILDVSDPETVAAYDPRTDTTTLVFTNDESGNDTNSYTLLDQTPTQTRVIRTTQSENFQSLGPASVSGSQVTVTAPGSSVTTVVLHHSPNLIQNGTFELGGQSNGSSSIAGWQVQGGGFYNFSDNTNDGSESGALWADNPANTGQAFQSGIGDVNADLTGMAFELSMDVQFQNAGSSLYDAETYLALEFYGADDQTLAHQSIDDFRTPIVPAIGIDTDEATDSEYRVFRTDRFVAPPGTRYVRPVIGYTNVQSGSTDWLYFDNAHLQTVHPVADGREWEAEGSGAWGDDSNWLSHALVDRNKTFYLGNAIRQASSITLSQAESVEGLTFFSEHQYQLGGTGSLLIGAASKTALVDTRAGSHRISVSTALTGPAEFRLLPNASLTLDSDFDLSGFSLTKLGAGQLDLATGFQMSGGRIVTYLSHTAGISLGPDAVLDGDLELLLAPGDELQLGDVFELVTYSTLGAPFVNVSLPELASGLVWDINYLPNALTAEIAELTFGGDFDGDGDVDASDLQEWQADFGVNGDSDADGDADSDLADLLLWQIEFGQGTATLGATVTVPEPVSLISFTSLVLSLSISTKRRHRCK